MKTNGRRLCLINLHHLPLKMLVKTQKEKKNAFIAALEIMNIDKQIIGL